MREYLVRFTPLEPYFFGGEKTFSFGSAKEKQQQTGKYFITSEDIPSQTTILGAIRYLGLPHKNSNYAYTETERKENDEAVGTDSFRLCDSKAIQSFGKIKSISPLFMIHEKQGSDNQPECTYYVKAPLNHNNSVAYKENEEKIEEADYTPFKSYQMVNTNLGKKWLPTDFVVKDKVIDGFLNLSNNKVVQSKDIIKSTVRVGINKGEDKKAFFKREYKYLHKGFSFAIFLKTDLQLQDSTVFLGQGKSAFQVTFENKDDDLMKTAEVILTSNSSIELTGFDNNTKRTVMDSFVYALSDLYVSSEVYQACFFANTQTRDFRSYTTVISTKKTELQEMKEIDFETGRIIKGDVLVKLIKAGSVFIVEDKEKFYNAIKNNNCQQIGFNQVIPKPPASQTEGAENNTGGIKNESKPL